VTGRLGRRRKQLMDALKETRGYCIIERGSINRAVCKTGFRTVGGPVVRQTME
jgi:hypothetical protein